MKKSFVAVLLFLIIAGFAGCASMGSFWTSPGGMLEYKYKPRMNVWKFEDVKNAMSADEKWELPTSMEYSQTRDIMFVTYSNLRQTTVTKTKYNSGFLEETTSEAVDKTTSIGKIYIFAFDKKTKILKWFKYDDFPVPGEGYHDGCELGDNSYAPRDGEKFTAVNAGNPASFAAAGTLESKLLELQGLKDKKIITDDEYKKMRQKAIDEFK